jgi:hypothetical protein
MVMLFVATIANSGCWDTYEEIAQDYKIRTVSPRLKYLEYWGNSNVDVIFPINISELEFNGSRINGKGTLYQEVEDDLSLFGDVEFSIDIKEKLIEINAIDEVSIDLSMVRLHRLFKLNIEQGDGSDVDR